MGKQRIEVDGIEIVKCWWESRGLREMLERWWRDAGREVEGGRC